MMRTALARIICCGIALAVTPALVASAQQRRRADGTDPGESRSAAPVVIPAVPRDPERPLVGVWIGEFRPGEPRTKAAPYTVVIEFLNGGYSGYSLVGRGASYPAPMRNLAVDGGSIRWEQPNSGGGTLVHRADLRGDRLEGKLTFRDFTLENGQAPPPATFSLRRRAAPR